MTAAVLDGPFTYATGTVRELADSANRTYALSAFRRSTVRRPFFKGQEKRASSQVSEFSSAYKEEVLPSRSERELADLQRRVPRDRRVLDDPAEKRVKYEIETGIMRDGTIGKPLEPWTAPGSRTRSMSLYFKIVNAEDGTYTVADFDGQDLDVLRWMGDERLVSVGDDMRVHPLSDAEAAGRRAYPGAKCDDRHAAIGSYLRDKAVGLVAAALFNHSTGKLRKRRRRAELVGADGMRATVALICSEANRIKAMRSDLADYRYLSATRCAEIIRALIATGFLDEIEPTVFIRRERSWRTIVRVVRRLTEQWDDDDIAIAAMYVAQWDAEQHRKGFETEEA